MLVLTRKLNESILIGDGIEIKILQVRGSGDQAVIRVGITAPKQVTVLRKEVFDEVVSANQQSAQAPLTIPDALLQGIQSAAIQPGKTEPDRKDK